MYRSPLTAYGRWQNVVLSNIAFVSADTLEKIQILSKKELKKIQACVDSSQLLEDYGGTLKLDSPVWPPIPTIDFNADILPANEQESEEYRHVYHPLIYSHVNQSKIHHGSPNNFTSMIEEKASPLHVRMQNVRFKERMTTAFGSNRMVDSVDDINQEHVQLDIRLLDQHNNSSNDDNVNLTPVTGQRWSEVPNNYGVQLQKDQINSIQSPQDWGSRDLTPQEPKKPTQNACCTLI